MPHIGPLSWVFIVFLVLIMLVFILSYFFNFFQFFNVQQNKFLKTKKMGFKW